MKRISTTLDLARLCDQAKASLRDHELDHAVPPTEPDPETEARRNLMDKIKTQLAELADYEVLERRDRI